VWFDVAVTDALPSLPVVAVGGTLEVALLAGAVKLTVTPETGLPWVSVTSAMSGVEAPPTTTDCGVPETTLRLVAAPAVFVSAKVTGEAPPSEAVTEYAPATVLAVAVTLACPVLPLVAVAGTVAEAPLEGAE
jgi:hypothetical protein